MNRVLKKSAKTTVAAIASAALIGGCASGGGGGSGGEVTATYADGTTQELTLLEYLQCMYTLFLGCGLQNQEETSSTAATSFSGTAASEPAPPVAFTSWSDHRNVGKTALLIQAAGPQVAMSYERGADGAISRTSQAAFSADATTYVKYGSYSTSSDYVLIFRSANAELGSWYAFADQLALEILKWSGDSAKSAFAEATWTPSGSQKQVETRTQSVGVVANPYRLGWDFQSFGAWEAAGTGATTAMGASSYGAATPAAALPSSGAATFVGKLGGLHVSPEGVGSITAADLKVDVNFSERTLQLTSTNTVAVRPLSPASAAPHLNVSGSLTYTPGSSAFAGTLVNAAGTMSGSSNGQFYGPAAQELGGVFALKSASTVEVFTGAYGAKR